MKIQIKMYHKPINPLGDLLIAEFSSLERELYIDGNRAPKAMEEIFFIGMAVAQEQYINLFKALKPEIEGDI